MSDTRSILVFDFGTGAGRCLVVGLDGSVRGTSYQEWSYDPVPGHPGGVSFDPEKFWRVLEHLAEGLLRRCGIPNDDIIAVTCTSQREGTVVVDRHGRELFAVPNLDERASAESEVITRTFGKTYSERTGVGPPTCYVPARLMWLRNNAPQLFERSYKVLSIGDWMNYKLTGIIVAETSLASSSGAFVPSSRQWAEDVLKKLGIDVSLFPPLVMSGEVLGPVRTEVRDRIGLRRDTPVIVGGADTQCGILGMGICNPGQVGAILGTTSPVHALVDFPPCDPQCRTSPLCFLSPELWVLESNAGITGLSLRWLRDLLCSALASNGDSYDRLNELAALAPPGARGAMAFLGWGVMNVGGQQSRRTFGIVFDRPAIPGEFALEDIVRATYEGMALAVAANFKQLCGVFGRSYSELVVGGGQTRSDLLKSILASACGTPLRVSMHPEVTALGAAMCAAVGVGEYKSLKEASAAMSGAVETVYPDSVLADFYAELLEKWTTKLAMLSQA